MHQKHNCRIHLRQIFLCVAETQAIFLLFHMFLWCSFTSNVWSHGINERNQTNSGAKALRILIFLWRSEMQLSVTSSYIRKWISPGLPSPHFSLASGLAPKLPSPSLSNACHAGYTALLVFHNPRSSFSTLYTTPRLACSASLTPLHAVSRPNFLPFPSLRLHRTPRFPHPAFLLFQTTIYTGSKIDFLEAICRLSCNRWRCLATLKFFPKTLKQRLKWS